MKVFLLKDIVGLGMSGEIVKVSDGHALNYLLPRKLCVEVTKDNEAFFAKRKKTLEHRTEVIATATSMLAERVKATHVVIGRKAHDNGKLYGSVGTSEIAEAFKKEGISIAKNQVLLSKPIKEAGDYDVTIKLSSRFTPTAKISVRAQRD
jgi:large subunit ribosomal protein L9